jgi:hypothetical protein
VRQQCAWQFLLRETSYYIVLVKADFREDRHTNNNNVSGGSGERCWRYIGTIIVWNTNPLARSYFRR